MIDDLIELINGIGVHNSADTFTIAFSEIAQVITEEQRIELLDSYTNRIVEITYDHALNSALEPRLN